jgi:hypothetical protein
MPGRHRYGVSRKPVKVLRNIPRHVTYRCKLEEKWRRKGYVVHFG